MTFYLHQSEEFGTRVYLEESLLVSVIKRDKDRFSNREKKSDVFHGSRRFNIDYESAKKSRLCGRVRRT